MTSMPSFSGAGIRVLPLKCSGDAVQGLLDSFHVLLVSGDEWPLLPLGEAKEKEHQDTDNNDR